LVLPIKASQFLQVLKIILHMFTEQTDFTDSVPFSDSGNSDGLASLLINQFAYRK
jgi:hypothetical protein